MTPEEYKVNLSLLEDDFNNKKFKLMREFAMADCPYKKDDTVYLQDGSAILVKRFSISIEHSLPVYHIVGTVLTKKKGEVTKKGKNDRWIKPSDVVKHIPALIPHDVKNSILNEIDRILAKP